MKFADLADFNTRLHEDKETHPAIVRPPETEKIIIRSTTVYVNEAAARI